MSFWTEATSEPKRNFRFQVQITELNGGETVIWWAKNFKTPSYSVSETTHDFFDNKYYFPGRLTWDDCTMTLVDPVTPNAAALTNQIIIDSGYKVKDKDSVKETMSKNKSVNKGVGNVVITIFNADGDPIEEWTLRNAFLKTASYSTLDYANDDLRTIDLTFRYDWAECDHPADASLSKQFEKTPSTN